MTNIFLIGLPGSGRLTLMKQLAICYKANFFYDFCKVEFNSELNVLTMLSNYNIDNISIYDKTIYVVLPKIFKRKLDKEYSEYFQTDINLIYDNDPFKEGKVDFPNSLTSKTIIYDYNIDHLKAEIDAFLKKEIDIEAEILKILKSQNINIPLSAITFPTK